MRACAKSASYSDIYYQESRADLCTFKDAEAPLMGSLTPSSLRQICADMDALCVRCSMDGQPDLHRRQFTAMRGNLIESDGEERSCRSR